jgi:prevent-host-death family protein
MSNLTFRNRQGELVDIPSIASTEVKNAFGTMLDRVNVGPVAITRHDAPRAVLLSFEEFQSLAHARLRALDVLDAEFDELLARMQTEKAKKGMASAFDATATVLGRTAVKAARAPRDGKAPRRTR